ncbi:MAG: hypothetical protein R2854_04450 [Caldilineaceae bacterium]
MEQLTLDGVRAYRIHAADLRADRERQHRHAPSHLCGRVGAHRPARRAGRAARLRRIRTAPFVAALAAVEADIPLIVTFRRLGPGHPIFGSNFAHMQAAPAPPPAFASTPAPGGGAGVAAAGDRLRNPNHIEPEPADGAPPARPLEPRRRR